MTQTAPRRLLLVAADATPRGTAAPIRRYRLGRVLMEADELIETGARQSLRSTSSSRPETMRPRF